MTQPLTIEQAQAIADVVIANNEGSWGIYDDLDRRFPGTDWISLCEPNGADPRPRIPRQPFIGPRLPNEGMRVMDRALKEHLAACEREMTQPSMSRILEIL
jgi:hypothetical protein